MTPYENEKYPWLAVYASHFAAFTLGMLFTVVVT